MIYLFVCCSGSLSVAEERKENNVRDKATLFSLLTGKTVGPRQFYLETDCMRGSEKIQILSLI